MKPSALRIERQLAKVEAELARSARPRRYCFYFDEEAEAKAQGLPCFLVPRPLSREEWENPRRPSIIGFLSYLVLGFQSIIVNYPPLHALVTDPAAAAPRRLRTAESEARHRQDAANLIERV